MFARLNTDLRDHRKIQIAGALIDKKHGRAIALGFYTGCILHARHFLTDGYLTDAEIDGSALVDNPRAVADALASAGLFERSNGGFLIHDFGDFYPSEQQIKQRRKDDRLRKRRERANGHT